MKKRGIRIEKPTSSVETALPQTYESDEGLSFFFYLLLFLSYVLSLLSLGWVFLAG